MSQTFVLPQSFRAASVACGIKRDASKLDLTLIVSDRRAAAAGVFTQNRVAAAPVQVSRMRVPAVGARAIVANSGNANACTGERGLADARRMTELVAARLGSEAETVLVCSTGIIGEPLPMAKIERGIGRAFEQLAASDEAIQLAARGIMTTDTVPKLATRQMSSDGWVAGIEHGEPPGALIRITGIAKGAAMIGPNMATMLSFIITDAAVDHETLRVLLGRAVDQSFNRISVEGHMSTNDTVLALANGAAGVLAGGSLRSTPATQPLAGPALDAFGELLTEVCLELAQAIVRDAEGAKHFVTIDVEGLRTEAEARQVAKTIAESALVKAAIYGADPNWGRFVSAAGYAGVEFAEKDLSLWLDGRLLYDRGAPVPFDAATASQQLRTQDSANLRLKFELGTSGCRFWTCDLTEEYIKLNADYHT